MIALSSQTKAYVAIDPVDFRKGIRGLQAVCRGHLKQDSISGASFCFVTDDDRDQDTRL